MTSQPPLRQHDEPRPEKPGPFAAAVAAAVRDEIQAAGWTDEKVVERAEWLAVIGGHTIPLADGSQGTVPRLDLSPGLAERLRGDYELTLNDLGAVAFVLGEDQIEFGCRVIAAGQAAAG